MQSDGKSMPFRRPASIPSIMAISAGIVPITLLFLILGSMMCIASIGGLKSGDFRGLLGMLWWMFGLGGIIGMWRSAWRFTWTGFRMELGEKILVGMGFIACAPVPFLGFEGSRAISIYAPIILAIIVAAVFFHRSKKNSAA